MYWKKITLNKKTNLAVLSKYRLPIMGLGAFLILFFHLWINIFGNISILYSFERFLRNTAYFGVDIFFLTSAIGLYHSLTNDNNIKYFYKKRFLRLFIPWTACCIITALDKNQSFVDFIKNYVGYNFFFKSIYYFKWYVPAIGLIYLIYPLFFKLFNKANNKKIFTIYSTFLWIIVFVLLQNYIRSDFYGLIWRMPIFMLGTLCEYMILNENIEIKNIYLLLIFIISLVIAYLSNGKKLLINDGQLLYVNYFLAFSSSMLLGSYLDNKQRNIALLNMWGKSSLELYLFQELIGMKLINFLMPLRFKLLINIMVFGIVSICCYLLKRLFNYIENICIIK